MLTLHHLACNTAVCWHNSGSTAHNKLTSLRNTGSGRVTAAWLGPGHREPSLHTEGAARDMPSNAGSQTIVDRITVALVPKASEGLQHLTATTGLSKTDVVNRAITLYEYIDSQLADGRDLILRDPRTGETQIIRLL